MSFEEAVHKNLIWADITTMNLVIELANAYQVPKSAPAFMAAMIDLKRRFERDLIVATEFSEDA